MNASFSHNVPIINGHGQSAGGHCKAQILSTGEHFFELDIAEAYEIPTLTALRRRFDTADDRITLTDAFTFSEPPSSLTERFVAAATPVCREGAVYVDGINIIFDPALCACRLSEAPYQTHMGIDMTAYLIDFAVINPTHTCTLQFTFEIEN